jgi:ribose-phosphate pyrophosphokinase
VSGMTAPSQKKMMLFGGRAYPELATEVADCMGVELAPSRLYDFASGEIMVRFLESVRGCDAFVLQSHTAPINQWIMEQLIMVDALKRASPGRTRRARAVSRSRPGSSPTCSPPRAPTG